MNTQESHAYVTQEVMDLLDGCQEDGLHAPACIAAGLSVFISAAMNIPQTKRQTLKLLSLAFENAADLEA